MTALARPVQCGAPPKVTLACTAKSIRAAETGSAGMENWRTAVGAAVTGAPAARITAMETAKALARSLMSRAPTVRCPWPSAAVAAGL